MYLFVKNLIINTSDFQKNISLIVEPDDKIEDIKYKIQDKIGISKDQQELCKDFSSPLQDDNKTLADYHIKRESTIFLFPKISPTVNCYITYDEGKKLEITEKYCACCCNTLWLKGLIKNKLGIDEKYQILKIDGKILEDSQSLKENNIFGGKYVNLSIKNLSVTEFSDLIKSIKNSNQ